MKGKEKCEFLRNLRKKVAVKHGVPYIPHDCHHEGECLRHCPMCDMEAEMLMYELRELEIRGERIEVDKEYITELALMGFPSSEALVEANPFGRIARSISGSHKEANKVLVFDPVTGEYKITPENEVSKNQVVVHLADGGGAVSTIPDDNNDDWNPLESESYNDYMPRFDYEDENNK